MKFKATFEASGFTNQKDLVDQKCTEEQARDFTEASRYDGTFPKNVLAVLGGHITDDDNQGESNIHVFVCVDLLIDVESEDLAERMKPPEDLLAKIADLMSTDFELDLEAHSWEVTEVQVQPEQTKQSRPRMRP